MYPSNRRVFLIGLALLLVLSTACALPAPLAQLIATSTSTSTATATATATATVTPLPPIEIEPCAFAETCSWAMDISDFIHSGKVEPGVENLVEVPYDMPINFLAIWIAADDEIARQNASKMEPFFEIDGVDYWTEDFQSEVLPFTYDDQPGEVFASVWQGAMLSGWRIGESHLVRVGFVFTEAVNDGWDTYPAGFIVEYIYRVFPEVHPTDTPTPEPTLTPTPRPTNTLVPRPTSIPATSTPSCSQNATITINNTTGGQVTLYLNGPARYTFYLGGGYTDLHVCSGSYSYTAYGCGGASDTGVINSGETHEFYCVSN
jgi:hypothetical protein